MLDDTNQNANSENKNNNKRRTEDVSGQPREASPSPPSGPLSDSEHELSSPLPSPMNRRHNVSPATPTTMHVVVAAFGENLTVQDNGHRAPPPPPPSNSAAALPATDKSQTKGGRNRVRSTTVVFGNKKHGELNDAATEKLIQEIVAKSGASDSDQKDPSTSDEGTDTARPKPPHPPTHNNLQTSRRRAATLKQHTPVAPLSRTTTPDLSLPLSSTSSLALDKQNNSQLSIPASALPAARSLSDGARGKTSREP
jgi:hypothetical protein